jgi:hypothetical protein
MSEQIEMLPKMGRPALLTPAQLVIISVAVDECDRTGRKFPRAEFAASFNVHASTVWRAAKRMRK